MNVGFVIPTLGNNLNLLREALKSIDGLDVIPQVVLVAKSGSPEMISLAKEFDVDLIIEEGSGLYSAINQGVRKMIGVSEYYSFLGDDDRVNKSGFEKLIDSAKKNESNVVYGGVRYVDDLGETLMHNHSFPGLARFLLWIPNLIPHPGTLIKVSTWQAVDGYDEGYDFAADLDFWLKIRGHSKFHHEKVISADFRYSQNTLTGGQRARSLLEASDIRLKHARGLKKYLIRIWNPILQGMGELLFHWNLGNRIHDVKSSQVNM